MGTQVLHKVGGAAEGFSTLVTWEGCLPGVGALMFCQGRAAAKTPSALWAGKGFLTSVDSLVPHQGGALGETFPTHIAYKGPLSGVNSLVLNEDGALREALPAFHTMVGLIHWTAGGWGRPRWRGLQDPQKVDKTRRIVGKIS